ncbi:hypothetical protein CLOBOL_02150 [Enterocloster bolteae ATCC BAA-613]|uniref:Uncharacterized protein n=1 Tax=Enterocloster bolteae (strain ATCC BAA-613 / DSM 15670 / CCUG 46953 / JCM 12243 / WAL 16351) TaxID=411902 RepID=A8RNA9_ENTBW|nr:hypothetical protein CLOBOL_02150 [Enterocloster bolteae ATCC BAA-613]
MSGSCVLATVSRLRIGLVALLQKTGFRVDKSDAFRFRHRSLPMMFGRRLEP